MGMLLSEKGIGPTADRVKAVFKIKRWKNQRVRQMYVAFWV